MVDRLRTGYKSLIVHNNGRSILLITIVALLCGTLTVLGIRLLINGNGKDSSLAGKAWNAGDYQAVYSLALKNLENKPLSSFWLMMNGMSSFQLAGAQINAQDAIRYIDMSIASLRKALMVGAGPSEARAKYLLGKAYFRKGPQYADSAAEFLEQAIAASYKAADIYEHLGLAYASLKDYKRSVVAFTQALGIAPSELLLLAIAKSYLELGEHSQARAYLIRCTEISKDSSISVQAHLLLGLSLKIEGDTLGAEREYIAALQMDDSIAEVHNALGELYADSGDTVRARAEWRKSLRIDPTNEISRSRLGL